MSKRAAITVNAARDEVERQWRESPYKPDAAATFRDAPGDRGTEIHVDLEGSDDADAKVKDGLRRFKQKLETGEIPRSDATPDGESVERKLDQRPAQPLEASELEELGV
ncbi:MAG TPA: hypothetical protein VF587_09260 [Solirubrobacteraceae bacterium]|jgi:hypothetical protein